MSTHDSSADARYRQNFPTLKAGTSPALAQRSSTLGLTLSMRATSDEVKSGSIFLLLLLLPLRPRLGRFAGIAPAPQAALSLQMWADIPRSLHSVSALLGSRIR